MPTETSEFHRLAVPLDRDRFARDLLREFADSLTKAAGAEKAGELIGQIGERTGAQAGTYYRAALKTLSLTRPQIAAVFLDLKRRIGGDSYIVEQSDEKIVLGDRACPLGRKIMDRPALCMMTSGVFGAIASQNTGYAKVELKETIAEHHEECRVVVYLKPTAEAERAAGREYLRADQRGS